MLSKLCKRYFSNNSIPWFTNKLPSNVEIVDLSARDGLQNESIIVSFDDKINLINNLIDSGAKRIEVGSFVSPKWVPQMSDSIQIFEYLNENHNKYSNINFRGLVLNEKGFKNAIQYNVNEILFVIAATNEFSIKNMNSDIDKTLERLNNIIALNKDINYKINIKIALSTLFGCPYKGTMNHEYSINFIKKIYDEYVFNKEYNITQLLLCDTVGYATPYDIYIVCNELTKNNIDLSNNFGIHFHDTYGQGLSNVITGLSFGINTIESCVAGLGGCPFAKNASGNIATEDVVYMLDRFGIKHGYNIDKLISTGNEICNILGKSKKESKVGNALNAKYNLSI